MPIADIRPQNLDTDDGHQQRRQPPPATKDQTLRWSKDTPKLSAQQQGAAKKSSTPLQSYRIHNKITDSGFQDADTAVGNQSGYGSELDDVHGQVEVQVSREISAGWIELRSAGTGSSQATAIWPLPATR